MRVVHGYHVAWVTLVACTVVVVVCAVRDFLDADVVFILNVANVADLLATAFAGVRVHFAVLDRRAAQVVLDFHVGVHAVQAGPGTLVVYATVDGLYAHVRIKC